MREERRSEYKMSSVMFRCYNASFYFSVNRNDVTNYINVPISITPMKVHQPNTDTELLVLKENHL